MLNALTVMFLLYCGLQLHALAKANSALALTWPVVIALLGWVALMTVMPLLVWRWEQRGWHRPVLFDAWIGYSWMGVAFLFFWIAFALDLIPLLQQMQQHYGAGIEINYVQRDPGLIVIDFVRR